MAGQYDFTIDQGTDWNLALTWKAGTPLAPVDLTNWHAHLQIRTGYADDTSGVLLDMTDGAGITLGGTAGTILLEQSKAQTRALSFDSAVYDLKLTPPTGKDVRLLAGTVTLSREVTV